MTSGKRAVKWLLESLQLFVNMCGMHHLLTIGTVIVSSGAALSVVTKKIQKACFLCHVIYFILL